ncbi:MAG: TVP38/TMEM64 family protein [Mycobacterium sp.]
MAITSDDTPVIGEPRHLHAVYTGCRRQAVVLFAVAKPSLRTLRGVRSAVIATARQIPKLRLVTTAIVAVILVALVILVPLPNAVQLRDWATSVGPWFPVAFFGAHVVVTVFPFPRTAFTLAAGLLFGPALGVALAVTASAISALLAVLLVRAAGWQLNKLVSHPAINSLDTRLRRRGWPAILSLRLIPAVPFSVLNYAAGASAVRLFPYTLATLVGLLPGTMAVVVLGDALTGSINPLLVLISVVTAALGLAGLYYETRQHRKAHPAPAAAEPEDSQTPSTTAVTG